MLTTSLSLWIRSHPVTAPTDCDASQRPYYHYHRLLFRRRRQILCLLHRLRRRCIVAAAATAKPLPLSLLYDVSRPEDVTVVITEAGLIPVQSVPVLLRDYKPVQGRNS